MKVNSIIGTSSLTKASTRSLYDTRLQEAKKNLTRRMYVQQIEQDYMQRNVRP